ncbi:rhamnan synthesis F family protein [Rhodobacter calidifons]|nr:rhamnan synthesis F family protein [Rhodobacter calidifons]
MIPRWKLRRELVRAKDRLAAMTGSLYEPFLQRRHDRWRAARPVPVELGVPFTGKVAIFLIYQPNRIAPSILVTLRWLVANGYAPLVVANSPIPNVDRPALEASCWRLFERPNFGYDFGGYRDGVLLLEAWGVRPDRLMILNDSVWMPQRADSTLLRRLEEVDADLVGGTMHGPAGKRRGHLESYLYLINRGCLENHAFRQFWSQYRCSNAKQNAIRRGERQFTAEMQAAGARAEGLFSLERFLGTMAEQSVEVLRKTLDYASYVEPEHAEERDALLAGFQPSENWKSRALAHLDRAARRRRFNAVFIYPCDCLLGMDFVKKSTGSAGLLGLSLHHEMRKAYLRAVAAGDLPPLAPEVRLEMENSVRKYIQKGEGRR